MKNLRKEIERKAVMILVGVVLSLLNLNKVEAEENTYTPEVEVTVENSCDTEEIVTVTMVPTYTVNALEMCDIDKIINTVYPFFDKYSNRFNKKISEGEVVVEKEDADTESETEAFIIVQEETVSETVEEISKCYFLDVDSDLRIQCNLSVEEYETMLEGTALSGIGEAIFQAEHEMGINGLYLLGLACLESGYGTTEYAVERNNIVGWGAYDDNPDNAWYFESKSACMVFIAGRLKENYLSEGGKYFEGYTPRSIDVHYCTDTEHADKIIRVIGDVLSKLG